MNDFAISYDHMKAKVKNAIRENMYFTFLLSADEMMFTYENLPESIEEKYIEDYLNISGSMGICKGENGYLVCPYPSRSAGNGMLNQYGDGMFLEGATMNGLTVSGEIAEDAVIIYNNTARGRQWDLVTDSAAFGNIDKSSEINVILSRIAPLFSCPTDTIKTAVKDIIKNIIDGNIEAVTSENVYDALQLNPGSNELKMLDITHPEMIQYIQYLSEYYDVLMRRHFSRRGLAIRTGTKAAQQNNAEIYGLDSVSWYMPLNKLKARQDGFREFNRIFGENVQVKFSEIWEQEYQAYLLRILNRDAAAEDAAAVDLGAVDQSAEAEQPEPEQEEGVENAG